MALDDSHITVLYGADGPIDWTFADVASTAVAAGGTSYLVDDFYDISDASDDLAYGVAIFPEYGDLGIESSSVPREHPHYELFREEAEDRRLKVEAYNAAEKRE